MKSTFALILLTLKLSSQSITFIPSYDNGYLDVKTLNNAIFLTALQADSVTINLVIPKGVYYLPNNQTIHMNNMVNLSCDSVTFVYKWESDEYKQNIIQFQDRTKAGISGLTIDFRQAYRDKVNWTSADKFVNRSIIQIEHSDHITIKNVIILKILGQGIGLSNSNSCIIKKCNIDGTWVRGNENGAMGYGICLVGSLCHDNLIDSNIINDSRHNVVAQYDAHNNVISNNKLTNAVASTKVLWFEVNNKTMNYTSHGNGSHHNVIRGNYADHRISIDNVKNIPNGPGNEIIDNTVDGLIDVQSKAPDQSYNCCQIIKGNRSRSLRVESKDCVIENNIKW